MISWISNNIINREQPGPRIENSNQQQPWNTSSLQNDSNPTTNSEISNHNRNNNSAGDSNEPIFEGSNSSRGQSEQSLEPQQSQEPQQILNNGNNNQLPSDKVGAGILIRTLKPGDATNFPRKNNTCRIHYEGYVLFDATAATDGGRQRRKIDSSVDRDEPFLFRLHQNQVIQGLDMAVEKMSLGQKAEVTIPALYGYGEQGYLPLVPSKATLVFEIELLDFTNL